MWCDECQAELVGYPVPYVPGDVCPRCGELLKEEVN